MRPSMQRTLLNALGICALATSTWAQVPAGGEFLVNTYTTANQYFASTAMEPDGDFVMVWTSSGQDGSSYGVFGQRFAASGARRGGEFQVNVFTTSSQTIADVALGNRGDFTVVWSSVYNGNFDLRGRRYDTNGAAIGGEFVVNTYTSGGQIYPRVGRASDGRFVVAWQSPNDGTFFGVAARRFDSSG